MPGPDATAGIADEQVARRGRDQHRPDHVRTAALVLLGHVDSVGVLLVAADRLVLGAVVAGHLRAAHRHQRRHERHPHRDRLGRRHRQLRAPRHRASQAPRPPAPLPYPAPRTAAGPRAGGAEAWAAGRRPQPSARRRAPPAFRPAPRAGRAFARRHLDLAGGCPDGRCPVVEAVHQDAVAKRHPAQANLVFGLVALIRAPHCRVRHAGRTTQPTPGRPWTPARRRSAPAARSRAGRCAWA